MQKPPQRGLFRWHGSVKTSLGEATARFGQVVSGLYNSVPGAVSRAGQISSKVAYVVLSFAGFLELGEKRLFAHGSRREA